MKKMNRRNFLKNIGKGAIALAVPSIAAILSGCNSYDNIKPNPPIITNTDTLEHTLEQIADISITPANQILRGFPDADKLLGAETVVKHETPGAKYCLIHIRQMHATFVEEEYNAQGIVGSEKDERLREAVLFAPRERWKDTEKSQKDIYDILKDLRTRYRINEIRSEGIAREYSRDELLGFYTNNLIRILKECYITEEEQNKNKEIFTFAPGAVLIYGVSGKLKILPGEDLELNKTATKNAETDINHPSIYGPREDFFIRASAQGDNPLIVGVYGVNHNFRDNIEKWNHDNPSKKLSLIVVTPKNR
jgi:hypothetical protein